MMVFFIVFVVVSIGLIIFLSQMSFTQAKTKEQFIKELARQLKGTIEPFEEYANSYRVKFNFEGNDFVFEDVELKGFQETVDKGFLKLQMNNKYSLIFSEVDRSMSKVRAESMIPTKAEEEKLTMLMRVYLPKKLNDLTVKTNDPYITNKIFEDPQLLPVFENAKNIDSRGYPSMALKVIEGQIIVEFSNIPGFRPSLASLRSNVGEIENYLDAVLLIHKAMQKLGYL